MSEDISGYGLGIFIVATDTFPVGFELTQFPKDTDPLTFDDITMSESEVGLNGDLISWSSANPIKATISLIPDSDDDVNMSILAEANRVSKGKRPVLDNITLIKNLPGDDVPLVLTGGKLEVAPPATGILQSGKKKTKSYTIAFESKTGVA